MSDPKPAESADISGGEKTGTNTDVPWYTATLEEVSPQARDLLENYSGIPPDQVIPHILEVRDRAFKIFPYPCIGQFRFLDLSIHASPAYGRILDTMRNSPGTALLDLGCCFGQDLRALAHAGIPSTQLYGLDLRPDFIDLGYALFRDRQRFHARFLVGDILDEAGDDPAARAGLDGTIDILHAASFFHLFDRDAQLRLGVRIARLLRPTPGAFVTGRQVGNVRPGRHPSRDGSGHTFRHDVESWRELWEEVGRLTGSEWRVEAQLHDWKLGEADRRWVVEGQRMLRFVVTRV